jgi:DNA processing protein
MPTPRILRPRDGHYPPALLRLADPPVELRLRGSLGTPARRVALVGARVSDEYGRDVAARLARGLARAGVSIVSGGALGVDAAAHQGALEAGGHTVAVLGAGVDRPGPPSNGPLFERILAQGGGLLSELPDGAPALPHHFVERNRIIAALCDAVVVVRAARGSGALITAERARQLAVPLLAVPGDLHLELSHGAHQLLREGARLATCAEDVLAAIGLAPGSQAELPFDAPAPGTHPLLAALSAAPRHLEEVARLAGVRPGAALAALLQLELDGLCEQRPGQRFLRRAG